MSLLPLATVRENCINFLAEAVITKFSKSLGDIASIKGISCPKVKISDDDKVGVIFPESSETIWLQNLSHIWQHYSIEQIEKNIEYLEAVREELQVKYDVFRLKKLLREFGVDEMTGKVSANK